MIHVKPVILCGGSGTRLWPLSRTGFPKQVLVLSGTTSLFQQAVSRLAQLQTYDIAVGETLVVTGEEHRFLVLDQLRELCGITAKLLLEPIGRNTAPALTLAALQAIQNGDDPVLVVTPADQTVQNQTAFTEALQQAIRVAANDAIVVLGIKPTTPETGFGYIQTSAESTSAEPFDALKVKRFVEKPDLETAKKYLASGDYSWNSGMIVSRASVWLRALKQFRLDILDATKKAFAARTQEQNFIRPDSALFEVIPIESIDYAVMENCHGSLFDVKMVPLDAGWNDLGTWEAVWQAGEKDNAGNVTHGDVILDGANDSLIHANHRLVAVLGLNNLIVIETADALLVADRNKSHHVKKIVLALESTKREERLLHRKVARPWGWYDTIDMGSCFKVKRIQVNPGASLSLQKHAKRSEHWVVVKGIANVLCGGKSIVLNENESTYIPLGETHRLSNPGKEPLEIIEVQSGVYLGEDDIVRFDDIYSRSPNKT